MIEPAISSWDGEQVLVRFDAPTGSWIFICIHSRRLGPAAGGTRMKVYESTAEAIPTGPGSPGHDGRGRFRSGAIDGEKIECDEPGSFGSHACHGRRAIAACPAEGYSRGWVITEPG